MKMNRQIEDDWTRLLLLKREKLFLRIEKKSNREINTAGG